MEKGGRKNYITERNGRSCWEQQGIVAFCTCQWSEWIIKCIKWLKESRFQNITKALSLTWWKRELDERLMQEQEKGGMQALQPCGLNLERKVHEYRGIAVYSDAVNIVLSHCSVVWSKVHSDILWFKLYLDEVCLSFLLIFLCSHTILSVEQTARQMINSRLSVSDVMFLVYLLSQFSFHIVSLTKPFWGLCTFLYDTLPT